MTPQNKLYEAVNAVIEIHEKESEDVFYLSHMDKAISELKKVRTALEQEQLEQLEKLKKLLNLEQETATSHKDRCGDKDFDKRELKADQPEAIAGENENGHLGKNTSIFSDKIYDSISSQQTSAKDKEISELEDALLDIIQVNEWKEKYGEDERYLQALPVALKNAKKLIQKQYESKDI